MARKMVKVPASKAGKKAREKEEKKKKEEEEKKKQHPHDPSKPPDKPQY